MFTVKLNSTPLSHKITKTKKCHSEARDRSDLIQTAPVPGGGLARHKIKINRTKKRKITNSNYSSDVTLAREFKLKKIVAISHPDDKWITDDLIKTKKCHSEARDRPDLIQTAPVPGGGLARPQNKNKQNEKSKNSKSNYYSHVTLAAKVKLTKCFSKSQDPIKTKKCHSEARDRPDLIQTAPVPGGGLARHKLYYLSHVTLAKRGQISAVMAPRSQSGHSTCSIQYK